MLGAGTLAHFLPAAAVLGTFLSRPPTALPWGWCRWRLDGDQAAVALTLDDGPSPRTTPRTLDLLDDLQLRATFFVVGEQAAAHGDLVAEMRRRGHAVGVHGYQHEHHTLRGPRWVRRDTEQAVAAIAAATGTAPRWIRPPYGQLTASTLVEARRHSLQVVLWSRWGKEFTGERVDEVLDRLSPGLVPGAIVLLHDSDSYAPAGTATCTHEVLAPLADELHRRGLTTVALGEP